MMAPMENIEAALNLLEGAELQLVLVEPRHLRLDVEDETAADAEFDALHVPR